MKISQLEDNFTLSTTIKTYVLTRYAILCINSAVPENDALI